MNLVKIFDKLFIAGVLVFIMFAFVLPGLFNMNDDVTLWMVFLIFGLIIYGVGRVVVKIIQKASEE